VSATVPDQSPWSTRQIGQWSVLTGVGVALMSVAWNAASRELRFADMLGWLELSLAGLLLTGLANVGWYLGARRAVVRLRSALMANVAPAPVAAVTEAGSLPVSADPMRRYHRPGCQLVLGRAVNAESRDAHEAAGRVPCGMCRP